MTIEAAMPYTNCEATYQGHWMYWLRIGFTRPIML